MPAASSSSDSSSANYGGPKRVWLKSKPLPGLAMTRSIGDMIAQSIGVIAKPEITRFELSVRDKVLVVASDGLWDRMSNSEVIQTILPFHQANDAENAVACLVRICVDRWMREAGMVDDITIIVAFLNVGYK